MTFAISVSKLNAKKVSRAELQYQSSLGGVAIARLECGRGTMPGLTEGSQTKTLGMCEPKDRLQKVFPVRVHVVAAPPFTSYLKYVCTNIC